MGPLREGVNRFDDYMADSLRNVDSAGITRRIECSLHRYAAIRPNAILYTV